MPPPCPRFPQREPAEAAAVGHVERVWCGVPAVAGDVARDPLGRCRVAIHYRHVSACIGKGAAGGGADAAAAPGYDRDLAGKSSGIRPSFCAGRTLQPIGIVENGRRQLVRRATQGAPAAGDDELDVAELGKA